MSDLNIDPLKEYEERLNLLREQYSEEITEKKAQDDALYGIAIKLKELGLSSTRITQIIREQIIEPLKLIGDRIDKWESDMIDILTKPIDPPKQ